MVRYLIVALLLVGVTEALSQTTTVSTGLWTDGSIWSTGIVPPGTATVEVNHSIFIDQNILVTTGTFNFGQTGVPDEYITDIPGGTAYTLTALTAGGVIDVRDGITTFEGAGNIDNSTLIVRAGATLILGGLTINNGSALEVYGTLIVNGNLVNNNNGSGTFEIFSGGYVQINGNYSASVGSVEIFGGGDLYTTGTITTTGSSELFGSTEDCTAGPCSARNLCGYTLTIGTDQVICSGESPVDLTSSTDASGTLTYRWQRASGPGNFTNAVSGTPPIPTTVALGTNDLSTYTIDPSYYSGAGTDFFRLYMYDSDTDCYAFSNPVSLVTLGATAWKGITSDWNTNSNWCSNAPPTSANNLSIEAFPPATTGRFMPVISSGTAEVRNLVIDPGASVTLSGTGLLNIYGNLTNNGSFSASGSSTTAFVPTNRTQTIGGASYTVFNNLVINNTHSNPTITANANFSVGATLTLTNGFINLSNNTLTVGTSATSTGNVVQTGGWVYGGNLVKYTPSSAVAFGSGNDLLPIGTTTDYRPFQVAHGAIAAGGYVRVVHTGALSSTPSAFIDTDAAPIEAISNSFWNVSAGGFAGVGATPFTIQASGTNFGTIADLNHIRLVQTSAAIAGSSPGTNSGTLTNPTIQRINVSLANLSTNTIRFGTTNSTLSPLPVTLIFLNAKSVNTKVQVDWATSKEEVFSHFVLEHSVDGLTFTALDEISGAGYNTTSRNDYSYTHTLPIIGNNYYRLKAVDLDGSYEYFGPVSVSYNSQSELWIHPNPSSSEKVEYKMNFSPGEGDRVLVYNQIGLLVADVPAVGKNGVVYFAEPLKAGAYILKYVSQSNTYYARFIVVE